MQIHILPMFDLKRFRKEHHIRQADLADEIGIVRTRLSRVENMRDSLTYEQEQALLEKFPQVIKYKIADELAAKSVAKLPLYETDPTIHAVPLHDDDLRRPVSRINVPGFTDCDFAFVLQGRDMLPGFAPGSIMVCKRIRNRKYFTYGTPYLIVTKDYKIMRRIHRSDKSGNVYCCADNLEKRNGRRIFEDIELPVSEIIQLFMVKGVLIRFSV